MLSPKKFTRLIYLYQHTSYTSDGWQGREHSSRSISIEHTSSKVFPNYTIGVCGNRFNVIRWWILVLNQSIMWRKDTPQPKTWFLLVFNNCWSDQILGDCFGIDVTVRRAFPEGVQLCLHRCSTSGAQIWGHRESIVDPLEAKLPHTKLFQLCICNCIDGVSKSFSQD